MLSLFSVAYLSIPDCPHLLSYLTISLFSLFLFWSIFPPSQCAFLVCLYLNFLILITLWLYPMSFPPEVCKSFPSLSPPLPPCQCALARHKSLSSSTPPPNSCSLLLTHLSLISAFFYSPCDFTFSTKSTLLFYPSLFLVMI